MTQGRVIFSWYAVGFGDSVFHMCLYISVNPNILMYPILTPFPLVNNKFF